MHALYLVQVKCSAEQSEPWDDLRIIETIPGGPAFKSLAQSK